jgi:hypothetical protein
MIVSVDFSNSADNYQIKELSSLIEIIPFKRYQTPDPFRDETLSVIRDGQNLFEGTDQDYVIINNNTFELNQPIRSKTLLKIIYMKG